MTWVILGHTFFFSLPYLDNPKVQIYQRLKKCYVLLESIYIFRLFRNQCAFVHFCYEIYVFSEIAHFNKDAIEKYCGCTGSIQG